MRVAIVGCGAMGDALARGAVAAGFEIAACVDKVRARAAEFAERFGATAIGWDALLKRRDCEIVAIATPTFEHASQIQEAIRAGFGVVVAGPLCATERDVERAVSAAREKGVRLVLAGEDPNRGALDAMLAQYASGRIGKAGFVRCVRRERPPTGEKNWYRDHNAGGGVLLNCVRFDVAWLVNLFGEPQRVFCQRALHTKPGYVETALATLRFADGPMAQLVGSWSEGHVPRTTIEICGDSGMIQFDSLDAAQWGGGGNIPPGSSLRSLPPSKGEFLLRASADESERMDGAVSVIRVLDAMGRSVASGKAIGIARVGAK